MAERDPNGILYNGLDLYLIDRRFSTTTYGNENIICKLLFVDNNIDTLRQSAENEVRFQQIAAENKLGPAIYAHGFYNGESPFTGYNEYENNANGETKQIPFTFTEPFYYIIMEYYSKKNGWKGPVYVSDNQLDKNLSNVDLFYNYLDKLIYTAGIANIFDPIMHFYYHPVHGLRMIDYGRCVYCSSDEQDCMNKMARALGLPLERRKLRMKEVYKKHGMTLRRKVHKIKGGSSFSRRTRRNRCTRRNRRRTRIR